MATTTLSISLLISDARAQAPTLSDSTSSAPTSADAGRDYKLIKDIPYLGTACKEKMDAYLPDPQKFPGARPAVIVIHGGGWYGGDKATPRELDICGTLARAGYACFSINYRLSTFKDKPNASPLIRHGWPDNLQDCRDSIRYVRSNASTYSVDAAHLALLGTSAGAHLSLLTAFSPSTLVPRATASGGSSAGKADVEVSTKVSCVISMYGAHHLRKREAVWPPEVLGADILTIASPETYFSQAAKDKDCPPVLIIHGDKDKIVLPHMAYDMAESMEKAGIRHELIVVPGAGHSFHLHPGGRDIEKPVLDFLAKYLK